MHVGQGSSPRRGWRLTRKAVGCGIALLISLGLAQTASAAEVHMVFGSDSDQLVVTADAGETNSIYVNRTTPTSNYSPVLVEERGGTVLRVGAGCQTTGYGRALCTPKTNHFVRPVDITLGDGNDVASVTLARGTIDGGSGNDALLGDHETNLIGGSGDDFLVGKTGEPTLSGGLGNDFIIAGTGNDWIAAEPGSDVVADTGGTDVLDYSARTEPLSLSVDGIQNDGSAADGTTRDHIGNGFERIVGGSRNDVMTGSAASEHLNGNAGDDRISGGAGNDEIRGGDGVDTLDGGDGNDDLDGGATGADTIRGGNGNDLLDVRTGDRGEGENGNDTIDIFGGVANGGAGNDEIRDPQWGDDPDPMTIDGGTGDDKIEGGNRADILIGGDGNDSILGGIGGDDLIIGGNGNDTLKGQGGCCSSETPPNVGKDTIMGGPGDDAIEGGGEDDILYPGSGKDRVDGGSFGPQADLAGYDIVSYAGETAGVRALIAESDTAFDGDVLDDVEEVVGSSHVDVIKAGAVIPTSSLIVGDHLTIRGGGGNDELTGSTRIDYIYGDDGNDMIRGGTNNDKLFGGANDDIIQGEDSNDELNGGTGRDKLEGGAGFDYLDAFETVPEKDTADCGGGMQDRARLNKNLDVRKSCESAVFQ